MAVYHHREAAGGRGRSRRPLTRMRTSISQGDRITHRIEISAAKDIDEVIQRTEELQKLESKLPYEMDGAVTDAAASTEVTGSPPSAPR